MRQKLSNQTRRKFLKNIGNTLLATSSIPILSNLGLMSCFLKKKKQPNVIIVMTDDQGYGDLSCHGNPYVKTPALNQLYQESVRLTNFHVDPCCSPTRASLLTGQYSARSGVWHTIGGRSLLEKEKVTMADVFQSNGYRTGIFGKWHLGGNYPFRPQDRGFQEVLVHKSGSVGNRWDYWGNDYFDDTYYHNGKPEKFEGYCNTVWFDAAIDFIKQNKENPFFCFLSTNIPHAPLTVENEFAEPFKSKVSDRLANYYGMITQFDKDFKKLQTELKNLNLEENTVFIFLTDNGPCPWFGGIKINDDGFPVEGYSDKMRGGKIWGYENAHRVPCFIKWPAKGIIGGKDVKNLTAHFDLFPTLIDCCEFKKPNDLNFDGLSLLPILKDQNTTHPNRTIFVHNQRVDFPVKYKEYQVLTHRWRLINPYGKEIEDMESFNEGKPSREVSFITDKNLYELYDIIEDPEQRQNVAKQFPDVVNNLNQKYEEWWDDILKDFYKYAQTIIGSDFENPITLYSHDAHSKNHDQIFVIHVERDGKYQFQTSRWPKESNKTIAENRQGDKNSLINKAHLKIGNIVLETYINQNLKLTPYTVHLKAGTTCLQTWFSEKESNRKINANLVYVERIGQATPEEVKKYQPSDPDQLLKG